MFLYSTSEVLLIIFCQIVLGKMFNQMKIEVEEIFLNVGPNKFAHH